MSTFKLSYFWGILQVSFAIRKIGFISFLVFNIIYCQKILKSRYVGRPVEAYVNHMKAVGELEPVLSALKIERDDKVISIPDHSINISLYLMSRRGYCNYNSVFEQEGVFENRINKGAKYLLVNDTLLLDKKWVKHYLDYPLLTYKNVKIFDVRPYAAK